MSQQHRVSGPKLFDKLSPQEVWREALGLKCSDCGAPGTFRILMFMPLAELMPGGREEEYGASLALRSGGGFNIIEFRGTEGRAVKYVQVRKVEGCNGCRKKLETIAAQAPSYVESIIENGPPPINAQVLT